MLRRCTALFAEFSLCCVCVIAQSTVIVEGTFRDLDGEPLAGALVSLTDSTGVVLQRTTSGADGQYSLGAIKFQAALSYEITARSDAGVLSRHVIDFPRQGGLLPGRYRADLVGQTMQREARQGTIFVATNRNRSSPPEFYGNAWTADPTYARILVDVPRDLAIRRSIGEISTWPIIHSIHSPVTGPTPHTPVTMSAADAYAAIAEAAQTEDNRSLLIYIPGCCTTFNDGIRAAALLAYDINFRGAVLVFSWPALGTPLGYQSDNETIERVLPSLRSLLETLPSKVGATKIHLVAHSLGGRLLAHALQQLFAQRQTTRLRFTNVVFIAPDGDEVTFTRAVRSIPADRRQRITAYVSQKDLALKIAEKVTRHSRAGQSATLAASLPHVETIDASIVNTSLLGHSYHNGLSVLADMFDLINNEIPAKRRKLATENHQGHPYWRVPQP